MRRYTKGSDAHLLELKVVIHIQRAFEGRIRKTSLLSGFLYNSRVSTKFSEEAPLYVIHNFFQYLNVVTFNSRNCAFVP